MTDNHANSEADRSGRATAPSLRYRVAKAIYSKVAGWDDFPFDDLMPTFTAMFLEQADAVLEMLTVHIPPIVASAIHGYADSQIVALDYHGDGSAIEEMRRLNSEAAQIANYATTHERWNGGQSS